MYLFHMYFNKIKKKDTSWLNYEFNCLYTGYMDWIHIWV